MSDELKELGEQLSESKMKELMQQLNEKAQSGALTQQDISEVLRNLDNASAPIRGVPVTGSDRFQCSDTESKYTGTGEYFESECFTECRWTTGKQFQKTVR